MTRHDGPLSVRRAYTPEELARLSRQRRAPGHPLAPRSRVPPGRRLDTPGRCDRPCRLTRWSSARGRPAPRRRSSSPSRGSPSSSSTARGFPATRSAASTSRRRGAGSWIASASSPGWRRAERGRSGACASSRPTAPCSSATTRPTGPGTAIDRTPSPCAAGRSTWRSSSAPGRPASRVREGMRVVDLLREGRRVTGVVAEPTEPGARAGAVERLPARLVVAADGRTSVVVRAARAPAPAPLAPPARARRRRGGRVGRSRARRDRPRPARLLDPESGRSPAWGT